MPFAFEAAGRWQNVQLQKRPVTSQPKVCSFEVTNLCRCDETGDPSPPPSSCPSAALCHFKAAFRACGCKRSVVAAKCTFATANLCFAASYVHFATTNVSGCNFRIVGATAVDSQGVNYDPHPIMFGFPFSSFCLTSAAQLFPFPRPNHLRRRTLRHELVP